MMAALDTNVLLYALGANDDRRRHVAEHILERLGPGRIIVPVQVLVELFHALTRKLGCPVAMAQAAVERWSVAARLPDTSPRILGDAIDLATTHRLQIFDAIILAASAVAGADLLLTEDLQDGFTWRGVTVANPFLPVPQPLLASLLR